VLGFDPFDHLGRQALAGFWGGETRWMLAPRRAVLDGLRAGYGVGAETFDEILEGRGDLPPPSDLEQETTILDADDSEASVICARSANGETSCFPVQANIHRNGILDVTLAPAPLDETVAAKAREIATAITEKLGAIGLITVELFVLPDGSLMVNELAPRPHNTGHHTLETSMTSQFAQHVRAVCGLPLGPVELRSPGVMINLLGDLWSGGEPDWELLLRESGLFLHLYGKKGAKPGRKMGHATFLAPTAEEAIARATLCRHHLGLPPVVPKLAQS
jgi:phosphoribosylaminoimidazole carboxylase (NCAIR synthetase)